MKKEAEEALKKQGLGAKDSSVSGGKASIDTSGVGTQTNVLGGSNKSMYVILVVVLLSVYIGVLAVYLIVSRGKGEEEADVEARGMEESLS